MACVRLATISALDAVVALDVLETVKADKKRGVRSSDDDMRRFREVAAFVQKAFSAYAPVLVVTESKSPVRNASASAKVSAVVGIIAAEMERRALPHAQASPQEVRQVLGLARAATKADIEAAAKAAILGPWDLLMEPIDARGSTATIRAGLRSHAADATAAFLACRNTDIVRALRPAHRVRV